MALATDCRNSKPNTGEEDYSRVCGRKISKPLWGLLRDAMTASSDSISLARITREHFVHQEITYALWALHCRRIRPLALIYIFDA